jgi:hypothetical protein
MPNDAQDPRLPALLWDDDLGNLVEKTALTHTRLTYHRTWETGLRVAIRVTAFSPDFFVLKTPGPIQFS